MNWLQKIHSANCKKQAKVWDSIKHPALVGLMGLGLLGTPDASDAAKNKKPPVVAPVKYKKPVPVVPVKKVNIEEWVDRVIRQESGGNPTAQSDKGARGLMQIMPETWADITKEIYGQPLPFSLADDPVICRRVGTWYLKWIQDQLRARMKKEPTIAQILAAYNGGLGRLQKKKWNVSRMPAESKNYARNIMNMP